jgi:hypothetical protein
MIPIVGDVLFDKDFVFSDGQTGEKWFVILADVGDSTDNVYVARVTSVAKSDPIEGCHGDDFQPVYFLFSGKTFKKDTWVQFDQILIFDFSRASQIKRAIGKNKQLSMKTMNKVLCCAAQSIHIDGYTEETLLKQAELFNC